MWWFLAERLEFWDVRDAAAFVGGIVVKSPLRLSWHDDADLREYLLGELRILSTKYEPEASTVSFSSWAGTLLRLRCVDWRRQRFGRTKWKFAGHVYERPRPELVPLDDGVVAAVDGALATRDGDRPPDWDSLVGGLFRDRDCARARDLELLGLAPPR